MVHIINTNNVKLQNADQSWRKAKCNGLVDKLKINQPCNTSQADVDAIANAMDSADSENKLLNQPNDVSFQPSKEEIAQLMINKYIQQNGGTILNKENKENKKVLFG